MFQSLHTTLVMTVKIAVLAFIFAAFTTQAAGPDPKGAPSAEKPKKPKYVEGELLVKFKAEDGNAGFVYIGASGVPCFLQHIKEHSYEENIKID